MKESGGSNSDPPPTKHLKVLRLLSVIASDVPQMTKRSRARLAAAVVYKNQIVAVGTNQKKSHPFQHRYSPTEDAIYLHAETDVIKNALKNIDEKQLAKATLYICRVKHTAGSGSPLTWGLSKPCDGCDKAIATFNIKNVVYSLEGEGNYSVL
jgi:deoxycytidylate deaminase